MMHKRATTHQCAGHQACIGLKKDHKVSLRDFRSSLFPSVEATHGRSTMACIGLKKDHKVSLRDFRSSLFPSVEALREKAHNAQH